MKVFFIGAGPGDPDLITLKGHRLIQVCPVILYAGSLVPEAVLQVAKSDARILNTASMDLQEIEQEMLLACQQNKDVARVHSGDPSLYGAIGEQIQFLQKHGIEYEVVPGVTAVSASAAWLGKELTLPDVSQSVIMTRYEGKTPFPERERLMNIAASGATLAIHLGVTRIHKIVEELVPIYGEDCPVAVCYRTSWPDQDKVVGTLSDIVAKVREKKFTRTSLILVGRVLDQAQVEHSYLYDAEQAHVFRPRHGKKARSVSDSVVHPAVGHQA